MSLTQDQNQNEKELLLVHYIRDTINDILSNEDRLNKEVDVFFDRYDADQSGKLDPDEFQQLVFGICGFIGAPKPNKEKYEETFKK